MNKNICLCSGVITDKNILPVIRLNFGRTQLATSSGVHTLGRLECSGSVALNGFPTSCEDLLLIGHTLNGFYSIKGTKMIESVYCDFTQLPSDLGKYLLFIHWFLFFHFINSFNNSRKRISEMDWLRRRQIGARPFLRSTQFRFHHTLHSNSVGCGGGERGKRHEFNVGDIHRPPTRNLLFLVYGTCVFASFIFCLFRSSTFFERGSNRDG